MSKLYFSIPDSILVRPLNIILIKTISQYPEWFYNDFIIHTAYGCPSESIWTGGRDLEDKHTSISDFVKCIDLYKKYKIEYKCVFTNNQLTKNELKDKYSNELSKVLNEFGGYATVNLPMLKVYLEKYYSNIKVCWSTTRNYGNTVEDQINMINQLSEYNIIVPPHDLNHYLERFKYPHNIEILANSLCIDNCPHLYNHTNQQSKLHLFQDKTINTGCFVLDHIDYPAHFNPDKYQYTDIITRNKFNNLIKYNIKLVKLVDRHDLNITLASYLHYFVKPNYRDEFIKSTDSYSFLELFFNTINCKEELKKRIMKFNNLLNYFDNH